MYVRQAPGFEVPGKEDWVCKLRKGLYGLPPSGRIAQKRLEKVLMESCDFKQCNTEPTAFNYRSETGHVNAGFYVDDGKLITDNDNIVHEKAAILAEHGLKGKVVNNPTKFLGIEYHYYENGSVLLHQEPHVEKMIFKQGLNFRGSKSLTTPTIVTDNEETNSFFF